MSLTKKRAKKLCVDAVTSEGCCRYTSETKECEFVEGAKTQTSTTLVSALIKVATYCYSCPAGKYQENEGQSTCVDCRKGFFSGYSERDACDRCPRGSFADVEGKSVCDDCAAGTYASEPGSQSCLSCAKGRAQASIKGLYCNECEVGSFADTLGQEICTVCPGGRAQSKKGQQQCEVCPKGHYSMPRSEVCVKCPNGKVAIYEESAICSTCPPQAGANADATTCQCGLGYAAIPGPKDNSTRVPTTSPITVSPTPSPTPGPTPPTIPATDSPSTNSPTNAQRTFQPTVAPTPFPTLTSPKVIEGDVPVILTCKKCPQGAQCDSIGLLWSELWTKPGYYMQNSEWEPCLLPASCPGGPPQNQTTILEDEVHAANDGERLVLKSPCAVNRVGVLCAVCSSGSSLSLSGGCVECGDDSSNIAWLVIVGVVCGIGVIIVYGVIIANTRSVIKAAEIEEQMLQAQSNGFEVDEYELTHDFYRHGKVVTVFGAPSPRPNFTYKLKITFGFVQILTNLMTGIDIAWPVQFKDFLSYFNIANLDFFAGASVSCVASTTYYHKLWFMVGLPFAVVALLYCIFLLPQYCANCGSRTNRKSARQQFWSLVMFTLFLIYPTCSAIILRLYQCKDVYGVSYLRTDLRIKCSDVDSGDIITEEYQASLTKSFEEWSLNAYLAIPAIVLIPIGIPCFMLWMLWRYRMRLNELGVKAELGFLYDAYERQCWWFEFIDMFHKLTIVALVAFFTTNPLTQLAIAMIIALCYFACILFMKPYLRKADDRVHQFAQCEVIMCMLAAYWLGGLEEELSDNEEAFLATILIGVFLVFCMFAFIGVAYSFWKVLLISEKGKQFSNWLLLKLEDSCCGDSVKKRKMKKTAALRGDGHKKGPGEEFYQGVLNLEYTAKKRLVAAGDFRPSEHISVVRNPVTILHRDSDQDAQISVLNTLGMTQQKISISTDPIKERVETQIDY